MEEESSAFESEAETTHEPSKEPSIQERVPSKKISGAAQTAVSKSTSKAEAVTEQESTLESTSATGDESASATGAAADISSAMPSPSVATEEEPAFVTRKSTGMVVSEVDAEAPQTHSAAELKPKGSKSMAEERKSMERLSRPSLTRETSEVKPPKSRSSLRASVKKSKSKSDEPPLETEAEPPPTSEEPIKSVEDELPLLPKEEEKRPSAVDSGTISPAVKISIAGSEVSLGMERPLPSLMEKARKGRETTLSRASGVSKSLGSRQISDEREKPTSLHKRLLGVKRAEVAAEGKLRYQNTYRLESKNPFNVDRVYTIIKTTIEKELEQVVYEPNECAKLAMSLSNDIKFKVRQQGYDRYKIAVQVVIGERKLQSVHSIMRFLWDVERDHYSFYTYENSTLFAIACVLGVYYE